jgi:hypothetical protein
MIKYNPLNVVSLALPQRLQAGEVKLHFPCCEVTMQPCLAMHADGRSRPELHHNVFVGADRCLLQGYLLQN